MSKTAVVLIERLGLAVLVAATTELLHHYGELGLPASFILGSAFTIIGMWLYALKQVATFKPYRLIIDLNYDALWEDLKLTSADGPKIAVVTFTAISAGIFARSDERGYSVNLDIYREIPCGARTWVTGPNGPTFFLRPVSEGYQFGVHVQEEWWKLYNPQLAPSLRGKPLAYDNMLVLGLLPYGYMPEHTRRWIEGVSFWYGFDRKQRRWKRRLQQEGWTFDDN